jgi:hypothetical protein
LRDQKERSLLLEEENHNLSFDLLTITSEKQHLMEELGTLKTDVTDDSSQSLVPLRKMVFELEQVEDEKMSRLVIDLFRFNSNEE